LASVTLALFTTIRQQERAELEAITRVTGQQIQKQFEIWFGERQNVLADLARRWPEISDEEIYRTEARTFRTWFPGFQAISWLDADGVARIVEPVAGNESVVGFNLHLHADPTVSEALDRAADTGKITRSGMLELTQGGLGFGTYTPIRSQTGAALGFINGGFRLDHAFQECLENRELATTLQQQRPDLRVTFMSGHADKDCGDGFLAKPFAIAYLLTKVARCLQGTQKA